MTLEDREAINDELIAIDLPQGTSLLVPRMPIEDLVFPASGLVSLMVEVAEGTRVEVGLVGREGVVGLTALLGETHAFLRAIVQMPGRGHRIPIAAFRARCETSESLGELVRRHAAAALLHASLSAACNAAHPVERRAARWLLAVQDRVGAIFPVTQEYLAAMISASRPVMNGVLNEFKAAGLIHHARGWIAITDAAGLEATACTCYRSEREGRERLLGQAGR